MQIIFVNYLYRNMLKQIYNLIIKLLPHNLLLYGGQDVLVCYDKTIWIMSESKDAILLIKKNNIINNINISQNNI